MMDARKVVLLAATLAVALGVGACGQEAQRTEGNRDDAALSGSIRIDGSTTVAPLMRAAARRFTAQHPHVRVSVGRSGNDRGFARLCRGQTDVAPAAEAIDADAIDACERGGIRWRRITVANDAVVVMVNPESPIKCLTTDQLTQIWRGGSKVSERWSQLEGIPPGYDESLIAWGPGTDTETYAYFTWAVNHVKGITRDYNNTLHKEPATVRVVGGFPGAIGYADYPYYRRNPSSVRLLALDSGDGCVVPSPRTIASDAFRPLARRLFLYVSANALGRPEVDAFLRFYLERAAALARQVGFVALTPAQLAESRRNLERLIARASA
jgi:phosphate transport system substrate-binding protein